MKPAVTTVVVTVALLAACGGGDDATGSTPSGEIDRGASLTIAQLGPPSVMDPHRARAVGNIDFAYLTPVYDQLLELRSDRTIGPMLATSWEMSDDSLTLDLELRTDVTFQDDTPVDAEVVVANLERARTLPDSTVAGALEVVDTVEAVDGDSVRIALTEPTPTFPLQLATNVGISSMVNPAFFDDPALLREPPLGAGSGAYQVTAFADDRVSYERVVDDYWDDRAANLARLEIVQMTEGPTRLNALRSGEVDVVAARVDQLVEAQPLAGGDEFDLYVAGVQVLDLLLNAASPGLEDPDVRRALELAIDRDALADDLLGGVVEPAFQTYPEGMDGYVPELDDDTYDPEEAERLLQEAGVDGLEISLIINGTQPAESVSQYIQDQLEALGIGVELAALPAGDSEPWTRGDHGGFVSGAAIGADPSTYVDNTLLGSENPTSVPEDIQATIDQTLALPLDDRARVELFEQLNRQLAETPVHIPLVWMPNSWLARAEVMNMDQLGLGLASHSIYPRYLAVAAP